MSDRHEIPIRELIKITKKLITTNNFNNHDFYSLLVLAIMTVNEYSRIKHHINTATRVDLTITFIPDLIQYIHDKKIISEETTAALKQNYNDKQKELSLMIKSYHTMGMTATRSRLDTKPNYKSSICDLL